MARSAASCGSSTRTRDINRVDFVRPTARRRWPDRRRAEERQLVQRRPQLGLLLRVRGRAEPAALLHPRQDTDAPGSALQSACGNWTARPADAWRDPRRRNLNDAKPRLHVRLTTGAAAATPAAPQDASAYLNTDIYRLSASATGTGWNAYLKNAFATKFGDSVRLRSIEKGTAPARSRLATSERSVQDGERSADGRLTVGGSVPATLSRRWARR